VVRFPFAPTTSTERAKVSSGSRRQIATPLSWLRLIAVLALVANGGFRVMCVLVSEQAPASRQLERDSHEYLELAASLASRGEFSRNLRSSAASESQWIPELGRTPAYPALLAGVGMLTSRDWIATIVLQHLLSLCVIGIATFLAWSSSSKLLPALLVVTLLALDLQGVAYANRILTETLYTFALLCGAGASALAVNRRSIGIAAGAGLCLGLSSLVRPTSFLLPLCVAVLVCLMARHEEPARRRRLWAAALALALAGSVVLLLQSGHPGATRYRSPAVPLLAVAGALAPLCRRSGEADLVGGGPFVLSVPAAMTLYAVRTTTPARGQAGSPTSSTRMRPLL
jgi:hypothetical protein